MDLILASSSPRRQMLLRSAGFTIKIVEPHIDETIRPGELPEAYVTRLADEKSRVPSQDEIVVAADTSVVLDGEILGKPIDEDDARLMLSKMSGRKHEVLTGFAVRKGDKLSVAVIKTAVTFRKLSRQEIDAYLLTKEPFDKAGSYGIQAHGASLIDTIEGSFTNVIGLPLKEVIEAIRHAQSA